MFWAKCKKCNGGGHVMKLNGEPTNKFMSKCIGLAYRHDEESLRLKEIREGGHCVCGECNGRCAVLSNNCEDEIGMPLFE
jgi:hypothetical protein